MRALRYISRGCLASSLGFSTTAMAAGPLGDEGSSIRTSAYSVDLYQGPVTESSRVIGLGGAYVAIAEGVEGIPQNPAAPAVRVPWSVDSFDYDLGIGILSPSSIQGTDFYNTGRGNTAIQSGDDGILFLNPAAAVQTGPWGFGLNAKLQTFRLNRRDSDTQAQSSLLAQFAEVDLVVARAFAKHQLYVGLALRSMALTVAWDRPAEGEDELFLTTGAAPSIGVLWQPHHQPFRVGASFKLPIETETDSSNSVTENSVGDLILGNPNSDADAIYLPKNLIQPWEASLGVALQFGERPLNPAWQNPSRQAEHLEQRHERQQKLRRKLIEERRSGKSAAVNQALELEDTHQTALEELEEERSSAAQRWKLVTRARDLSRSYVLVSASVQLIGATDRSVGVESFIQRKVARAGEQITVSPRIGVETEVLPERLKLRAGTYIEPSRYRFGTSRMHGTVGGDLKLFHWTVFGLFDPGTEWRIGGAMDLARHYFGWSSTIGVWH